MNDEPNLEILPLVRDIMADFPSLYLLASSGKYTYYNLLTAQNIQALSDYLSYNDDLVSECGGFLDMLGLLSYVTTGNYSTVVQNLLSTCCEFRGQKGKGPDIASETTSSFIFKSSEGLRSLLERNPSVLSIYIYLMFYFTFEHSDK